MRKRASYVTALGKEETLATQAEKRIQALEREVEALKLELKAIRDSVRIMKLVKSTISGPRMSDVFVDAQAMPLTGRFTRSGEREVELDEPIGVFAALKGIIGTEVTIVTEINNVKKEETVTMKKEKEFHEFEDTFADFKL